MLNEFLDNLILGFKRVFKMAKAKKAKKAGKAKKTSKRRK